MLPIWIFQGQRVHCLRPRCVVLCCVSRVASQPASRMTSSTATCWTIVHQDDSSDQSSDVQSLRNALEKGSEDVKIQTMQKILILMLNGNPLPGLLMHVIRFVSRLCASRADVVGHAQQEQAAEEAVAFLLGGLSENKPRWKIEAGDDSCVVSSHRNISMLTC